MRPHLPARRSCEVPFREIVAANFYALMHGATLREVMDLFGISAAYLTRLQIFVLLAIIQGWWSSVRYISLSIYSVGSFPCLS